MNQRTRILVAVIVIVLIAAGVTGVELLRRRGAASNESVAAMPTAQPQAMSTTAAPTMQLASASPTAQPESEKPTTAPALQPGNVPILLDGALVAGFAPADLEKLTKASFVDAAEGKTQDGWLLKDVVLLYVQESSLSPQARLTISSSARQKSIELTWEEVSNPENHVLFDLSNRGTLKLVSTLEKLDSRDEWVQDADKIEIATR